MENLNNTEKIKENLNLFYEPEKFVKKFCKEE